MILGALIQKNCFFLGQKIDFVVQIFQLKLLNCEMNENSIDENNNSDQLVKARLGVLHKLWPSLF